jgi:glucokinase
VHLTLGSGIGSGIILDGRIWRGACGFAAELGHLLVNSQGRACGCGNSGCAETESSEAGIVKSYQEYAGSTYPLSSRDVFHLLQQGDGPARRAFQRAGGFLGVLFSQIVYALNPEWISIGGGVAAAGEALLGPAREELSRRVIAKAFACTSIRPARLGNAAGISGAAALARQMLP